MPIATANPLHRSAPSPTSFPQQICLLADDLTGACDAAAAFLPTGRAVRVWLGGAATFSATEPVQAYNTDSRSLSPVKASRIVSRSAAALASNPQILFLRRLTPQPAALLPPKFWPRSALPDRAPSCWPGISRCGPYGVPRHLGNSGCHRPAHADRHRQPLSAKERSLIALVSHPRELAVELDAGKSVLLCDASTQSDLEALVRAAEKLPGLLFAGSAGLAQALAGRDARRIQHAPPPSAARTLLVAGSDHPVTSFSLRPRSHRPSRRSGAASRFQPHRSRAHSRHIPHLRAAGVDPHRRRHRLARCRHARRPLFYPPWRACSRNSLGQCAGGRAEGCIVITKSGGFGALAVFSEILNALRGPA